MATRVCPKEAVRYASLVRRIAFGLALVLLAIAAVGCQSDTGESAALAAEATQPTATLAPTATPQPTETPQPTATPAPPTPTPEPSPTTAPTKVPTPEVVTIAYMDPETDENPSAMPQWLRIYRPADVTPPYPTIFLLPSLLTDEATDYRNVAKAFMTYGYAVVLVKYQDKAAEPGDTWLTDSDLSTSLAWTGCALAWTVAYGSDYDLDLERLVIFSHATAGTDAAAMPLYDEAMWTDVLAECGHPMPAPGAVKGVVTFDAVLGIPSSNLQKYPNKWAQSLGIPLEDMQGMVDTLNTTPPEDWYKAGVLDAATRDRLARTLPLYWVYKTTSEGAVTPSYDFIYDRAGKDVFEYVPEAEGMANHMRAAGIDVTLKVLQDANGWELIDPSTDVGPRVVEAAVEFIQEILH